MNTLIKLAIIILFLSILVQCNGDANENNDPIDLNGYFTNPIKEDGADPWIISHGGYYYYSESDGAGSIYIIKSSTITGIKNIKPKLVWKSPGTETGEAKFNTWGPHINYLNNKWYIYFAAQTINDPAFTNQRMWVLTADTDDPLGSYSLGGEVLNSDDEEWAIDGSVIERSDGSLYFVWSGISNLKTLHQHSYIAKMIDPVVIDRSTITRISSPTLSWETSVRPIQEGQRPLYVDKEGKTIIMYSANASWSEDYCLASLTNTDGDFLNVSSWTKSEEPLFHKTSAVFGPGGASYVKSPDSTENWIVYHAQKFKGSGWERNIRTQKFLFDEKADPVFGEPVQEGIQLKKPSGE
ncbi:MAG: glycoside hydrolase family 43 protein [Bacteroidales bacterium]|nr:glycoside hydrolase family 43 protein [Bacteroidales bacterium]